MKKLILILGDLASGKSTTADILSKKYAIPALKKDTVKEILGDTIGFANREENLRLSRATFEILLYTFDRTSLTGGDLILESNFRESELERLIALAEERGYSTLSMLLTADTRILYQRYLKRISEGRHPVHLTIDFDNYEGFVEYVLPQRRAPKGVPVIKINADDFSYQNDPELFSKIDEFLND
jgi:predicted kinase